MVILDNGHGVNTPGKCSPDKKLREYAWCREIVKMISEELTKQGIKNTILVPEENDVSISTRVKRANAIHAKEKSFLVSVHINAAGGDGKWHTAKGWSVFCSKNASANSKKLASGMTDIAIANKMTGNRSIPKDKFWTWSWTAADIGILKSTNCPAVLTENFFMDNKEDYEYLMGDKGKKEIVDLHVQGIKKYLGL